MYILYTHLDRATEERGGKMCTPLRTLQPLGCEDPCVRVLERPTSPLYELSPKKGGTVMQLNQYIAHYLIPIGYINQDYIDFIAFFKHWDPQAPLTAFQACPFVV